MKSTYGNTDSLKPMETNAQFLCRFLMLTGKRPQKVSRDQAITERTGFRGAATAPGRTGEAELTESVATAFLSQDVPQGFGQSSKSKARKDEGQPGHEGHPQKPHPEECAGIKSITPAIAGGGEFLSGP